MGPKVMLILFPMALIAFTGLCLLAACLCVVAKTADAELERWRLKQTQAKADAAVWN